MNKQEINKRIKNLEDELSKLKEAAKEGKVVGDLRKGSSFTTKDGETKLTNLNKEFYCWEEEDVGRVTRTMRALDKILIDNNYSLAVNERHRIIVIHNTVPIL